MIALPLPLAPLSRLLRPFRSAWVQDAWPRATPSRLTHCLLLALLLHVWLVLMLGNAPPGTALPGLGVWGALNVTLRGAVQDAPGAVVMPPAPRPAGLPGTAASPRAGGAVRPSTAQSVPEPGAARRGDWAATPPPAVALPIANQPASDPVPLPPPVPVALPLPLPLPPSPSPSPSQPGLQPPAGPAERRLGAAPGPPAPAVRAAPLQRVSPLPPVADRLPLPLPDQPALSPHPAMLAAAEALPTLTTLAPPAAMAAPTSPAERAPVAPVLRQVAPMPAAMVAAPALAPAQGVPAPAPLGLPTLPAGPAGAPLAAMPAGRPDAGPQAGHDVATAPSAPASAPRLNLELARARGGELSRQAGAGVLPLLPRPPELPDKLARDIEKSAKADCRKAYQGLGVLAVVPLAVDAVRGGKDSGCKW